MAIATRARGTASPSIRGALRRRGGGGLGLLDVEGGIYDPEIFVDYTRRIIEGMGGSGPGVDAAARDLYDAWSACHHFTLYEEVPEVLRALTPTASRSA